MSYQLSKRSRGRLIGVLPILITIINEAIVESPFDFGIPANGGRRTAKKQRELYSRGRTTAELLAKGISDVEGKPDRSKITWTLNSKHLKKSDGYGHAFDIYAYVDKKASWDLKYLEPIAIHLKKIARSHGVTLIWGQDAWGKDGAHFQFGEYDEV